LRVEKKKRATPFLKKMRTGRSEKKEGPRPTVSKRKEDGRDASLVERHQKQTRHKK